MSTRPDSTPANLSCRFDFEGGLSILVIAASNDKGCPAHNVVEHFVAVEGDGLALDRLSALLDDLEPHARALDARELVECRFFGRCGEDNHRF